jgi:toxin HigB-1
VFVSFGNVRAEAVWQRRRTRAMSIELQRSALRKLLILDAAETLGDLRVPLGNRLETLSGDRLGQFSIRINQQWRICFVWTDAGPADVEIVDYH